VGDVRDGLGEWSEQDIVQYLKTGANRRAAAFGPMAEVVHDSTQYLDDDDLHAIAVYLKDLPGGAKSNSSGAPSGGTTAANARADATKTSVDRDRFARGRGDYIDQCAGCHMENGEGLAGVFPPLKGNNVVQASDPGTLVHIILSGAKTATTVKKPTGLAMPAFDWKLDDDQVAAVATYLRNSWGNLAPPVSAADVGNLRQKLALGRVHVNAPSAGSLRQPGPGTLAPADTDSRDNGTPQAGRAAASGPQGNGRPEQPQQPKGNPAGEPTGGPG